MLLQGTLLTPVGQPMVNSAVRLVSAQTSGNVLASIAALFITDADGAYSFDCPIGRYRVQATGLQGLRDIGMITITAETVIDNINELLMIESTAAHPDPILAQIGEVVAGLATVDAAVTVTTAAATAAAQSRDASASSAASASASASSATASAALASTASAAIQLSTGIFSAIAPGLAATAVGGYFSVPSADSNEYLILYQNVSGSAAEISRYPNVKALKAVAPKVMPLGPLGSRFTLSVGGKILAYYDKNGKFISDHTHAEITSLSSSVTALQSQSPKTLPLGPLKIRFGVSIGGKWVLATSDDSTIYPIQAGGSGSKATVVPESIVATSLVAAQPILMKDPAYVSNLLVHKVVVGQSNAFGRGSFVLDPSAAYDVMGTTASPVKGDVLSKTDSIYGNYALGLFSTDSSFRILKETVSVATDGSGNITGSGETLLSGWANGFQKWLRDNHYLTQRMVGTVHAVGGTKYPAMKKGTVTYNQALARVTTSKNISSTNGWNYEVQSISIVHGEAEGSDTTQSIYEGYLLEWWSDYNTDLKAITGQKRDLAAFLIGLGTFTSDNQQIPLAQLSACEKYPALVYVCPSYMFPYGDDVHRLAKGNFKHGEYEMRAERFWISGKKWNPLKPKSITNSANVVTIQFNNSAYGTSDTPGPVGALTLDTTSVTDPGNYGFRIANSTAMISSVALGADKTSVVITLSATPEPSAKIEYAMQYDLRNSGAPADPYIRFLTAGARGNIRDSDTRDISAFDGAPLYNWLVPFRQAIQQG